MRISGVRTRMVSGNGMGAGVCGALGERSRAGGVVGLVAR